MLLHLWQSPESSNQCRLLYHPQVTLALQLEVMTRGGNGETILAAPTLDEQLR